MTERVKFGGANKPVPTGRYVVVNETVEVRSFKGKKDPSKTYNIMNVRARVLMDVSAGGGAGDDNVGRCAFISLWHDPANTRDCAQIRGLAQVTTGDAVEDMSDFKAITAAITGVPYDADLVLETRTYQKSDGGEGKSSDHKIDSAGAVSKSTRDELMAGEAFAKCPPLEQRYLGINGEGGYKPKPSFDDDAGGDFAVSDDDLPFS